MPETAPRPASSTDWPDPVELLNMTGTSPIVLICEHASRHIPAEYAGLGLGPADLERHIAWDIGAEALTRQLSALLDAPAFLATYSRLLIDLNRPLDVASSIPVLSEDTDIPGNHDLPPAERARRIERIFTPFHDQVAAYLDQRVSIGQPTLLLTIHSFTPVYLGQARPWPAGILFDDARAMGERLVHRLEADGVPQVGTNQPYRVSRQADYAIPIHGDQRDIPAILIEIRNNGLGNAGDISAWADRLVRAIAPEVAEIASGLAPCCDATQTTGGIS
jgi:predicted N-formylglutamate amidohydrolase